MSSLNSGNLESIFRESGSGLVAGHAKNINICSNKTKYK